MPPSTSQSPPKTRPVALSIGLYAALFPISVLAALKAPQSEALGPIFVSALCGSVVAIFWIWSHSEVKTDDRSLRDMILRGMIVDVLFNFAATRLNGSFAIEILSSALAGIGNLGVLTAAIGVGLFVGRGLKKPNYLVLAAIVGAITDVFSVYAGPSKHIHISGLFYYLSFQWGIVGQKGVQPTVGAGDFIFLTLYFFGSRKFGLDDRKTLWAMILAITIGFIATLYVGAVPALPFMSAALFLTHGRELKRQMQLERQSDSSTS